MLLSLILLNAVGYLPLYYLMRSEIRSEMSGSREASSVIVVSSADKTSINWVEENELEYKGQRYDLLHSEQRGDKTYYYCIHDAREQSLVAAFNDHVRSQAGQKDASKAPKVIKLVIKKYTSTETLLIVFTTKPVKEFPSLKQENIRSAETFLFTPPPEAC